jgi:hypothetical protein
MIPFSIVFDDAMVKFSDATGPPVIPDNPSTPGTDPGAFRRLDNVGHLDESALAQYQDPAGHHPVPTNFPKLKSSDDAAFGVLGILEFRYSNFTLGPCSGEFQKVKPRRVSIPQLRASNGLEIQYSARATVAFDFSILLFGFLPIFGRRCEIGLKGFISYIVPQKEEPVFMAFLGVTTDASCRLWRRIVIDCHMRSSSELEAPFEGNSDENRNLELLRNLNGLYALRGVTLRGNFLSGRSDKPDTVDLGPLYARAAFSIDDSASVDGPPGVDQKVRKYVPDPFGNPLPPPATNGLGFDDSSEVVASIGSKVIGVVLGVAVRPPITLSGQGTTRNADEYVKVNYPTYGGPDEPTPQGGVKMSRIPSQYADTEVDVTYFIDGFTAPGTNPKHVLKWSVTWVLEGVFPDLGEGMTPNSVPTSLPAGF